MFLYDVDQIRVMVDGGPCVNGYATKYGPGVVSGSDPVADDHHDRGFRPLGVVSGGQVSTKACTPYKVRAYGAKTNDLGDGLGFLWRMVTRPDEPDQTYTVTVDACEGADEMSVLVESFLPMKVAGTLAWGFELNGSFGSDIRRESFTPQFEDTGKFTVRGGIDLEVGTLTYSFGDIARAKGGKVNPVAAETLFRAVSFVFEPLIHMLVLLLANESKADLKLPNLEIEMAAERKECWNDWRVQWHSYLRVGLKPLLGASVTVDIAEHLINIAGRASAFFTGPIGPIIAVIINKWRERLKDKNFPLEVGIDLEINGSVEGQFEWWLNDSEPIKPSGKVETPIEVTLKAYGQYEVRRWKIAAGARIEGGLKSRFGARITSTSVGRFPGTRGQFFFDGLEIYYFIESSFGFGILDDKPKQFVPIEDRETEREGKAENSWKWLDEAAYPADPSAPAELKEGDF